MLVIIIMWSYNDILVIEIQLLELDMKGKRKMVRRVYKELQKLLALDRHVFSSSQDYLIIKKLEELVELYEELI